MRSRSKVILTIIAVWIFLVSIILVGSSYISMSGFGKLEQQLAIDNSDRVFHVILSNLEHIYLQNLDNAYWDETYNFLQTNNKSYIDKNFLEDFFIDNKYNYVIFVTKSGKIVWSTGYDLDKKKFISVEPTLLSYFKNNSFDMVAHPRQFYHVVKRDYGISGFLQIPNTNSTGYFAVNYIKDSNDTKPPIGALVFGKILSPQYIKQLSLDLDYPINILPLKQFSQNAHHQKILASLQDSDAVYTEPLNEDILLSYRLVRDLNNEPIDILRVDLSRKLYTHIKESSFGNQLMLLGFAMIAALGLSALVYMFFRKQDLITRSFERFVPHQLIELLQKADILDVHLGNNSQKIISVLFMDIRDFTTISEGLTPQANFDFINTILKEIAPIISANNGFIDKYIGDAIMAVFPNEGTNADDAVRAAMMIIKEISNLNAPGKLKTQIPVRVGIGINTGESMLGIIGAEGRLEGTVISDMVNTASRIQSLTKTYQCSILISEECFKNLHHAELYTIKHVDDVQVKGKSVKTSVYSVD